MPVSNHLRASKLVPFATLLATLSMASAASAELVVSQMIVELAASSRTADIMVMNNNVERAYVSIEPRELINPGMPDEHRVTNPDPRALGLLLSSTRLILEPHQKRLTRLAATSIPNDRERIYRVVVKPITGDIDSAASGLKMLVGYDMLVMVKPTSVVPVIINARRTATEMTLTNAGNSSVELLDGQHCRPLKRPCTTLPAKRLYAGATWTQRVPAGGRIEYRAQAAGKSQILKF